MRSSGEKRGKTHVQSVSRPLGGVGEGKEREGKALTLGAPLARPADRAEEHMQARHDAAKSKTQDNTNAAKSKIRIDCKRRGRTFRSLSTSASNKQKGKRIQNGEEWNPLIFQGKCIC